LFYLVLDTPGGPLAERVPGGKNQFLIPKNQFLILVKTSF
jgi:hypothetical protein